MYKFIDSFMSDKTYFFYLGRVALFAILKSMGVKENDEVIIQVFTCFEVPTAIIMLGATPIFVDIDPKTLSIDPNKLKTKITNKTKAIIVQHTFGIPAEINNILHIAKERKIPIVEDCCHSFGSKYCGQETGTFGDAAFYSFGWIKPISLGMGGVSIINNNKLKNKMDDIYIQFKSPKFIESILLNIQRKIFNTLYKPNVFTTLKSIYHNKYFHKLLSLIYGNIDTNHINTEDLKQKLQNPYSKRIIPSLKQNLFTKLQEYNEIVDHQNWVVDNYRKVLIDTSCEHFIFDERYSIIFYKYPILSEKKDQIYQLARKRKIELSEMFRSPLHIKEKALWRTFGYKEGECPISEDISNKIIPLSVHKKIDKNEIKKIELLFNPKYS